MSERIVNTILIALAVVSLGLSGEGSILSSADFESTSANSHSTSDDLLALSFSWDTWDDIAAICGYRGDCGVELTPLGVFDRTTYFAIDPRGPHANPQMDGRMTLHDGHCYLWLAVAVDELNELPCIEAGFMKRYPREMAQFERTAPAIDSDLAARIDSGAILTQLAEFAGSGWPQPQHGPSSALRPEMYALEIRRP